MATVTVKTCVELERLQWTVQQQEQKILSVVQEEQERQASVNLVLGREIDKINAQLWRLGQSTKPSATSGS